MHVTRPSDLNTLDLRKSFTISKFTKDGSRILVNLALIVLAWLLLLPLETSVYFGGKIKNKAMAFKKLTPRQKDICLVLEAAVDHNGAFKKSPVTFEFGLKDHMKVITKKVACLADIEEAISHQARADRIKMLWIRAHGEPQFLELNVYFSLDQNTLNLTNAQRLEKALALLNPQAAIVLESCEAGKEEGKAPCIASKIAELTTGRKVFASQAIACNECYHLLQIDPVQVLIVSPTVYENQYLEIFKNFLSSYFANCFGLNLFPWHVTRTYQVTPKK